jgi:hypothetical protein
MFRNQHSTWASGHALGYRRNHREGPHRGNEGIRAMRLEVGGKPRQQKPHPWYGKISNQKRFPGFLKEFTPRLSEDEFHLIPRAGKFMGEVEIDPLGATGAQVGEEDGDQHVQATQLDRAYHP